jgi:hypothetical protein
MRMWGLLKPHLKEEKTRTADITNVEIKVKVVGYDTRFDHHTPIFEKL